LRLGESAPVAAGLRSKDRADRRLAVVVFLEEGQPDDAVATALLGELAEARASGTYRSLESPLRAVSASGPQASATLAALEVLVGSETADPDARDLAAAVALGVDAGLPWARARVLGRLAAPPSPATSGRPADRVLPTTATVLAAALDRDLVAPDRAPPPPAADDLTTRTLMGRPVGLHVAAYVARHPTPDGPYTALLVRELEVPIDKRALDWSAPTLRAFVELGAVVPSAYAVKKAALEVLATARPLTPERRALFEALQAAPDPWLRHLAARALRRSATK
jgi:hypothetical protein